MTGSPGLRRCGDQAVPVWALHDGKVGIANQVLGLAEAVGLPFAEKRLAIRYPWLLLPGQLWAWPLAAPGPAGDRLAPPWPDLVIACGRRAAPPALAIRSASRGRTLLVQIQNPHLPPSLFDLLVVQAHDRVDAPNAVVTRGAVHRVTPEKLAAAAGRWLGHLASLPRPLVTVLIGGANRSFRLGEARMAEIAQALAQLAERHKVGLLITPSRRTGAANVEILRRRLAGLPAEIWDGSGENPYFAYLGLADWVLVTEDSISMATEAASTGKPVYIVGLEGGGGRKFREFHQALAATGATRPFAGDLERWCYDPVNDTGLAAARVRQLVAERQLLS